MRARLTMGPIRRTGIRSNYLIPTKLYFDLRLVRDVYDLTRVLLLVSEILSIMTMLYSALLSRFMVPMNMNEDDVCSHFLLLLVASSKIVSCQQELPVSWSFPDFSMVWWYLVDIVTPWRNPGNLRKSLAVIRRREWAFTCLDHCISPHHNTP